MRNASLVVLLATVLLVAQVGGLSTQSTNIPVSTVGVSASREVTLNVKIVFLGLSSSDVNSTYLTARINVPEGKPQSILAGLVGTGVNYKFEYQTVFADSSAVSSLVSFLGTIEARETTFPGSGNLRNPYFENTTVQISSVANSFYDARLVEEWFATSSAFGTAPVPGYTLYVADLHTYLPNSLTYQQYQNSTTACCTGPRVQAAAHYYNQTVTDPDLRLVQDRHYMTAWGGNHRFYYLDLSAGPSYWTGQLPIQVAAPLNGVDLSSDYGRYWRTSFLADYIAGVVFNLFAPDQIYPVNYSSNYNFHLFVLDNRTVDEKSQGPSIFLTVNETMIRSELESFLPYSNVTLTVKYNETSDYPGLESVIARASTGILDKVVNGSIVDARLVYNWLGSQAEGHVSDFLTLKQDAQQLDIPAFIFIFSGQYNFGFTFKEEVISHPGPSSIFGVALGDIVLISHAQHDLTAGIYPSRNPEKPGRTQPGKGVGFSRTIIHEFGHMLGLPHPFQYDPTEDFTDTIMGYYPPSLGFSQFDRDMQLRGINDQLLLFAEINLANTTSNLFNSGQMSAARAAISRANAKYAEMRYDEAVQDSYEAALNAFSAHELASSGVFGVFSPGLVYAIIGVVVGVGIGLLLGFLVFRKRPASGMAYYRCPTCGQPLRWDAAMMRWYCDRCQKPI